jgi:tungstate transport system substrate-binding protein
MFNEFVIVGPKGDPAGVAAASDATEAFRRIAQSHGTFISRGDGSGTEERQILLWKLAGVEARRIVAGAGMGATLRIADQMDAYTLADGATFAQNAHALSAGIVFKGDPRLLNTYAVVCGSDSRGRRFAEWLNQSDAHPCRGTAVSHG